MTKAKQIFLKRTQIEYLLELIYSNEEEGNYWGRKDYFENPRADTKNRLEQALKS